MSSDRVTQQFQTAMFDVYRRAKSEAKYNATVCLNMLNDRGAISTTKFLINAPQQSDGFTALHLAGRLDLTVEALVVEDERWHALFLPEEIEKARHRLRENHYVAAPRR